MAQHDYVIDNASGASVRSDLNNALSAIVGLNSGASAPSTTYADMLWMDTTNGVLKQRNSANTAWKIIASRDTDLVITKTSNYPVVVGDYGKTILADGSSGTVTVTLPAAATAGEGFWLTVKATDISNQVDVDGNGAETIDGASNYVFPAADVAVIFVCDGTNWQIAASSASAAAASDTVAGVLEIAVQSELEAASSNTLAVTPGRAQYHPGVAKAWAAVSFSGGTPSLDAGHNVSASITDNGTGDVTLTFTTAFSSANYVVAGAVEQDSGGSAVRGVTVRNGGRAAGSCRLLIGSNAGTEDRAFTVAFYGDQ